MYFRVIAMEGEPGKWKIRIALTQKDEHDAKISPAACRDLVCKIYEAKEALQHYIENHTFYSVYAANAFYHELQAQYYTA